jgi:hypothetical protein
MVGGSGTKVKGGLLIQSVPFPSTNAETKIIAIMARKTTVATIRTGLNI